MEEVDIINNKEKRSYSSIGVIDLLVILFIGLKLSKVIDWSWWAVLFGWWIQIALGIVYLCFSLLVIKLRKNNRAKQLKQQKVKQNNN